MQAPTTNMLSTFVQLCLIKGKPQDLPTSRNLMLACLGAYILTNVIQSLGSKLGIGQAVMLSTAEGLATLGLLWVFLKIAGKEPRLVQSATALFGAMAIAQLITSPYTAGVSQSLQVEGGRLPISQGPSLIPLMLLGIWFIAIMANVLRHTFETTFFKAVLMTFGIKLLAVFLINLLVAPTTVGTPAAS